MTNNNLMPNWKPVILGDVLEEVDLRVKDLNWSDDEQMPVLSLTKDHGLIPQRERFIKQVATTDLRKYKVIRKGWIAYNPYVIWEGAIHALTNSDLGIVSPAYIVWKTKNSDADFINYLLRSPLLLREYLKIASGTVKRRRAVKKTSFAKIEVNLPPVVEQARIGIMLKMIQKSISLRKKEIGLEKEHKESLLSNILSAGVKRSKTKKSDLGNIPDDWNIVELGTLLEKTQYGLSVKGTTNGKYPILRMNSLNEGYIALDNMQYVDLKDSELASFKLNEDDILFNRTNSHELVGKTAIFRTAGDYVFASYLIRLVTNKTKLRPEYLNNYINWTYTQRRLKLIASKGVSQSNISASKISRLLIHLPPIEEQAKISELLNTTDQKIILLQREKLLLEELYSALFDQLLERGLGVNTLS